MFTGLQNATYKGVFVGVRVRGSIGNEFTYRVRTGNGFYESIKGVKYQDKYQYFIPSSIYNPAGQPARDALATAVDEWSTTLSEKTKKHYRDLAKRRGGISGYNLYISKRIKEILT